MLQPTLLSLRAAIKAREPETLSRNALAYVSSMTGDPLPDEADTADGLPKARLCLKATPLLAFWRPRLKHPVLVGLALASLGFGLAAPTAHAQTTLSFSGTVTFGIVTTYDSDGNETDKQPLSFTNGVVSGFFTLPSDTPVTQSGSGVQGAGSVYAIYNAPSPTAVGVTYTFEGITHSTGGQAENLVELIDNFSDGVTHYDVAGAHSAATDGSNAGFAGYLDPGSFSGTALNTPLDFDTATTDFGGFQAVFYNDDHTTKTLLQGTVQHVTSSTPATVTPEPGSLALFLPGFAAFGFGVKRRKRAA
jgi:hypothetical protein